LDSGRAVTVLDGAGQCPLCERTLSECIATSQFDPDRNKPSSAFLDCSLPERSFWEGARRVNSTLKIKTPSAITLIEKIKAELKKRAELKAKRMLLKVPKRQAKR
jgi:hypothetical protein